MHEEREALAAELAAIAAAGLQRRLREIAGAPEAEVESEGRRLLLLCSNNSLGLATHPAVRAAVRAAVDSYGCSAGASRLVAGHLRLHAELEARLAAATGAEAALLFPSGYQANLGLIPALAGAGDQVFSDELNHASIVDGCRLSRATVTVYPHADPDALERLLAAAPPARRRLVVTESLFSMDGDRAPLDRLASLADQYHGWLVVDEAHAFGVLGENGSGLARALGERVVARVGTLGKALGSAGAFVAGPRSLVELLVNRARTFIYTTGLAPPAVAAAAAALDVVATEPERRRRLLANAVRLREGLARLGFRLGERATDHIIPLLVGDNRTALVLAEALRARGVLVQAIRPPTVPPDTARLRITAMATHSEAEIERALAAFAAAGRETGILGRVANAAEPGRDARGARLSALG